MNQPCECGHAGADHWLMPSKCRVSTCDCTRYRPASDSTEGQENSLLLKNWIKDVPKMREENLAAERDALVQDCSKCAATRTALEELVEGMAKAVNDEPELPEPLPEEMWLMLKGACEANDRDAVNEAFRITVRLTKDGIRERLAALSKAQEAAAEKVIGEKEKAAN